MRGYVPAPVDGLLRSTGRFGGRYGPPNIREKARSPDLKPRASSHPLRCNQCAPHALIATRATFAGFSGFQCKNLG